MENIQIVVFADAAVMLNKRRGEEKVIFSGHLPEVLIAADGQAVHALLIRDKEALRIEAVCRAADAICTFVNYLHSAPQI